MHASPLLNLCTTVPLSGQIVNCCTVSKLIPSLFLSGFSAAACSGGLRQHRHSAASGGPGDAGDADPAPGRRGQVLEGPLHGCWQILRGKQLTQPQNRRENQSPYVTVIHQYVFHRIYTGNNFPFRLLELEKLHKFLKGLWKCNAFVLKIWNYISCPLQE